MTGVPASSHGGSAFNGGTITGRLAIAPASGASPELLALTSPTGQATDVVAIDYADQNLDAAFNVFAAGGCYIACDASLGSPPLYLDGGGVGQTADLLSVANQGSPLSGVDSGGRVYSTQGFKTQVITSGALPTVAPVSGAAFQCSTTRDVFLTVPVTYNPGVATTATCKVELSPDNVTFSELVTVTQPVGTVFDGSIEAVQLIVPAAWRVKLTVVNATLGTGTYY